MKRKAARYVSEWDTCQKVKADYMEPGGLLQPLSIPKWKWDYISMDFIVGLPTTTRKFDSIWVIVDRLQGSKVCGGLHSSRVMFTRSSEDDNLRLRFVVCHSLLGATTRVPQNSLDPQFGLSPTDGWPN
jgi:hypothetical protein